MGEARAGTFLATSGYAYIDPYPAYASLALGKGGLRTATTLLHEELKDDGVHATSITIHGPIAPDTALAPDLIAERYWTLHNQPVAQWTDEIHVKGELQSLTARKADGNHPSSLPLEPEGNS